MPSPRNAEACASGGISARNLPRAAEPAIAAAPTVLRLRPQARPSTGGILQHPSAGMVVRRDPHTRVHKVKTDQSFAAPQAPSPTDACHAAAAALAFFETARLRSEPREPPEPLWRGQTAGV